MWFPDVSTLIPAEKSSPALLISTPIPPAAFSAFAMARSIFSSLIKAGTSSRTALRAGRPITSPKIKIRMILDFDLLRSSSVSRHRQVRDEPWKARASEFKGSVQARAVGITTSGADQVGSTRHRPVARAWKGSSLVLKPKCLHTYELLDKSKM